MKEKIEVRKEALIAVLNLLKYQIEDGLLTGIDLRVAKEFGSEFSRYLCLDSGGFLEEKRWLEDWEVFFE